jgi:hypothetical protein
LRASGERYTPETLASLVAATGGMLQPGSAFRVRTENIVCVTQDRVRLLRSSAVVAYSDRPSESRRFDVLLLLHGTSGFTRDCGPNSVVESRALAAALDSCIHAVVAPDYLGMERRDLGRPDTAYDGLHPSLVGEATAIASLDAVRAVRRLVADDDGHACTTARVGLFGASQSGRAALWVERLAPYYARELMLVGGVAAVPATDLLAHAERDLSSVNSPTPFFAAMLTAMPPVRRHRGAVVAARARSRGPRPRGARHPLQPGQRGHRAGLARRHLRQDFLDAVQDDGLGATDACSCMVRDDDLLATSLERIPSTEPGYGLCFVVGERDDFILPEVARPAFTAPCARDLRLRYLECRGAGHVDAVFRLVRARDRRVPTRAIRRGGAHRHVRPRAGGALRGHAGEHPLTDARAGHFRGTHGPLRLVRMHAWLSVHSAPSLVAGPRSAAAGTAVSMSISAIVALLASLATAAPARAATYHIRPGDDFKARLRALVAGDEAILHAGTYDTGGFFEVTWSGTAERPIVVRAADGERPVLRGVSTQNVLNLGGTHFVLRGLEIVGGSHGIRLTNTADATFEDLRIHGTGDVGFSCNRPGITCARLTIRGCEIYDTAGTGEGMYLGCNDGTCTFRDSIVERNYLHDLRAGSQGDGIEVKTGSFGNVIRDNVIVRSKYPAITIYGYAGDGPPNVVERNLIWGTEDNGIQLVGQAIVRNNLVIGAGASGIASKPSQGFRPSHAVIVHNTVLGAGDACLRMNEWGGESGNVVANNALYCPGGIAMRASTGTGSASIAGNVVVGSLMSVSSGTSPGRSPAMDFEDAARGNLYPAAGSPLVGTAATAHAALDDFDLRLRDDGAPDVGAYERTAAGRAWVVAETFKGLGATPPPLDAGVPDAGPSDAGARPDAGDAPDGGRVVEDGGPFFDAGGRYDAGDAVGLGPGADARSPTGAEDGGCSCSVPAAARARACLNVPLALGLITGLALTARRRRLRSGSR